MCPSCDLHPQTKVMLQILAAWRRCAFQRVHDGAKRGRVSPREVASFHELEYRAPFPMGGGLPVQLGLRRSVCFQALAVANDPLWRQKYEQTSGECILRQDRPSASCLTISCAWSAGIGEEKAQREVIRPAAATQLSQKKKSPIAPPPLS